MRPHSDQKISTVYRLTQCDGLKGLFIIENLAALKTFVTTKFMKNTSWLIFEQVFRMALSLIVTSLLARYLGAEQFGILNMSLAYILILTTVTNLGIDSILINEIIQRRSRAGEFIGTTLILRMMAAIISVISITAVIVIVHPGESILHALTIVQALSLFFVLFDTLDAWFQSNYQSKYAVIAKSIAFTTVSGWRLVFIFLQKPLVYFAIATIVEALIMGVLLFVFYHQLRGPKLVIRLRAAKHLLKKAKYFFVANLLIMLYTQLDKIMLGVYATSEMVGLYAAAMAISSMWMFVPGAFLESARPLLMEAKQGTTKHYVKKVKTLFCFVIWLGIIASIGITLCSEWLIALIYGAAYSDAKYVLIILIWSRIFAIIGTVKAIWLTIENLGRFQIYFVAIAAACNVLLNWWLIPAYGAVGAAISTLIAELLASMIAVLFFKQTQPLFNIILDALFIRTNR